MDWIGHVDDKEPVIDTFGKNLTVSGDAIVSLPIETKDNVLNMAVFSSRRGSIDIKLEMLKKAKFVVIADEAGKTVKLPVANIDERPDGSIRFSISAYNVKKHLKNTEKFSESTACFQIDLMVPGEHSKEKKAILHWIRPNRFGCLKHVSMDMYIKLADQLCVGLGLVSCELYDAAFGQYCGADLGPTENQHIRDLKTILISVITFLKHGTYYYSKFGYEPFGVTDKEKTREKYCKDFIRVPVDIMLDDEAKANEQSNSGTPLAEFVNVVKGFKLPYNANKPTGEFIRDTLTDICNKYKGDGDDDDEIKAVFKKWFSVIAFRFVPKIANFIKTY